MIYLVALLSVYAKFGHLSILQSPSPSSSRKSQQAGNWTSKARSRSTKSSRDRGSSSWKAGEMAKTSPKRAKQQLIHINLVLPGGETGGFDWIPTSPHAHASPHPRPLYGRAAKRKFNVFLRHHSHEHLPPTPCSEPESTGRDWSTRMRPITPILSKFRDAYMSVHCVNMKRILLRFFGPRGISLLGN